ncbi:hypothetical protein WDW37_02175 [Bdellovibrionota bacterium FG-1]
MKSENEFKWGGLTGDLMQKHLALRAAMGRVSKADEIVLRQFNEFLNENYPKLRAPNRLGRSPDQPPQVPLPARTGDPGPWLMRLLFPLASG